MSTTEHEEVADPEVGSGSTSDGETGARDADPKVIDIESDEGADESDEESLDIEVEATEEDPVAALNAKIEELEASKKENYDRFVRASADLENYRKRARRDIKDARLDERGKILKDMLPVIDNLERAVAHAKETESEATKSIIEGVNLVLRQFQQSLERHNVKAVEAVGSPFDPALHEAVSQAPSADHPPGTVISVLQTGYMVEDRLLRPALAVVSVAMPEAETAKESASDADKVRPESEDASGEVEDAADSEVEE